MKCDRGRMHWRGEIRISRRDVKCVDEAEKGDGEMPNKRLRLVIILGLLTLFGGRSNAQWVKENGFFNGPVKSIVVLGDQLFAGADGGGVFRYSGKDVWTEMNSGLWMKQIQALVASGPDLYAGSDDGGVFYFKNDQEWVSRRSGLWNTNVHALVGNESILFASTNDGVYCSTDGGKSWNQGNLGQWNKRVWSFVSGEYNTFAAGDAGLFRSINSGLSWTQVHFGFPCGQIRSVALIGADLFAATDAGVLLTTDNGLKWSVADSSLPLSNALFLVASGGRLFTATPNNEVFLFNDAGKGWTKVTPALPSGEIATLAVLGSNVYVGTLFGIWRFPLSGTETSNPPLLSRSQEKIEQNLVPTRQRKTEDTLAKKEEFTKSRARNLGKVDIDIPVTAKQHPNAIALILAIQKYQSSGIPEVKYARHDAQIIREYLIKALGFRPENILPADTNAQLTYGRIQTYIKSILPSYLKPDGSSELFVYFTGHGAPSTLNHEAYLVPWDGDPNYVNDNNSYSMKKFYLDLELLNARKKIIVIDACFSGMDGAGQSLIKYASPALLKVNNPLIADPSTVIFQSSGANQVSNWYDIKKHGMFTYFFLKGLQGAADLNGDGKITAEELIKYINNPDDGLPYYSNRLYQRPQEAQLEGDGSMVIERLQR